MIASTCALAALLALDASKSPASTGDCQLTDNRCKARRSERRAAAEPTPEHRARYLHSAHRSYLFLFDETGDTRDLCAARRTFDASLAVKEQSAAQRASFEAARGELVARERRSPTPCSGVAKRRARTADPPLVAAKAAQATAASNPDADTATTLDVEGTPRTEEAPEVTVLPTTPRTPDALMPVTLRPRGPAPITADLGPQVEPPGDESRARPVHSRRPGELGPGPVDGVMPVAYQRGASPRRSSVPRPGRGLVIASGVSLGVGVALGVSAGLIDGRMTDTRRAIEGLHTSIGDGYGTEAQNTLDDNLRTDYRTSTRLRAGLAIGAGATVVVAVVLAAVGGRKLARAASHTALLPAPGGLVFRGHF